MLEITRRIPRDDHQARLHASRIQRWLTLPFELRQKSRLRARLDDGSEVAIVLARGGAMRDGDVLVASDGTCVGVRARPELLSVASSDDGLLLLRAAYHLGNRHVPLQIDGETLSYVHDHVLDAMLEGLGMTVLQHYAPFEPEAGAYHSHARTAHGAHDHAHDAHSEPRSHGRLKSQELAAVRDESEIPTRVELARPRRKGG